MKKFTVEIYCGYSDYYEVMAEDENEAEDKALELYEQDFVDMYDLQLTEQGYTESDNIDDDGELIDEDDVTTIGARVHV